MVDSKQVTVVFQGSLKIDLLGSGQDNGSDFLYNVARTRAAYPQASIILSTWDNLPLPAHLDTAEKLGIDKLILSPDPGGLPNIKFGHDDPNNVNRQIVSSQAGLRAVITPYAIKLRTDSFLLSDNLLHVYDSYQQQLDEANNTHLREKNHYAPIIVPHLFTIDPEVYEHMAYHVSDWAQFGQTADLQEYWSVDLMSREDACYFERHSHDADASYGNDAFRTRLAVEQHIATHYAKARGYTTPEQYNQITDDILQGHRDFLAKHIIVLDTSDFGLALPKYAWAWQDWFMQLNCLNHDDWYQLFSDYWQLSERDAGRLANAEARRQQKRAAREAFEAKMQSEQAHILTQLYP